MERVRRETPPLPLLRLADDDHHGSSGHGSVAQRGLRDSLLVFQSNPSCSSALCGEMMRKIKQIVVLYGAEDRQEFGGIIKLFIYQEPLLDWARRLRNASYRLTVGFWT